MLIQWTVGDRGFLRRMFMHSMHLIGRIDDFTSDKVCLFTWLRNTRDYAVLPWTLVLSSVATLKNKKNLIGPIQKPKKIQGHISIHLAQISGKNPTFPVKNPNFPPKVPFYPQKFLTTFFLVINSDF